MHSPIDMTTILLFFLIQVYMTKIIIIIIKNEITRSAWMPVLGEQLLGLDISFSVACSFPEV